MIMFLTLFVVFLLYRPKMTCLHWISNWNISPTFNQMFLLHYMYKAYELQFLVLSRLDSSMAEWDSILIQVFHREVYYVIFLNLNSQIFLFQGF